MNNQITVPQVHMDDHAKIDFATEVAFGSLVGYAKRLGLPLQNGSGLMYLPDQQVTRQFQLACRAVLAILSSRGEPDDQSCSGNVEAAQKGSG